MSSAISLPAFGTGFFLGLSLIVAIGAQNAFVLRQGLRRAHVFWVAMTCGLSDAILIVVGVAGFGYLADQAPWIEPVFRWGGALFLVVYGLLAFRSAWTGGGVLDPSEAPKEALLPTLLTCLALTWLNPHVYLDTVVLLGSIASQWDGQRVAFGAGATTASFVFFFSLAYGARLLTPLFMRPSAWRILDVCVGIIMWAIALGLIFS